MQPLSSVSADHTGHTSWGCCELFPQSLCKCVWPQDKQKPSEGHKRHTQTGLPGPAGRVRGDGGFSGERVWGGKS